MRRRIAVVLSLVAAAVVSITAPVAAQSASDAASDLRENNVTFEEDAPGLTQNELDRLDNTAANLQTSDAFFKVIVLASPVEDFSTPREFAEVVLRQLGGAGRVVAFDTERVGIASTAGDPADEIARAEEAASAEANRTQSYAEGVDAAADVLGVSGGGSGGSGGGTGGGTGGESDSSSGSSMAWLWVVLIVGVLVVGGLFLWSRLKKSKAPESAVSFGEGEMKVRSHQDRAGNLVLELADRVELPGAPPEAKQLFQQGAAEFADLQDDLEQADTRPELEVVYPRIVDAVWKLESAKALLEGQPAPAQPAAEPLFPAPPAPAQPTGGAPLGPVDVGQQYQPVPQPSGYRSMGSSPWLTTAATAALSMLAGRMMAPDRSYRPPASDDIFLGGGSRGSGRRRRGGGGGGISLSGGSGGRGMGRRR